MIRAIAISIALFLVQASNVSVATAADVSSRIEAVTVYPSGATVTRVASVSVAAGDNTIRLIGLVGDLSADGLRVELSDSNIEIGQVQVNEVQRRDAYDADVAELQARIEQHQLKMYAVVDSTEAARLQLQFLEGVATGYGKDAGYEGSRGAANISSWESALQLLASASESANQKIRSNEQESRELARDLSVLQREMQVLQGGALRSTSVSLSLRSPRATEATLRLHYFQEDAEWVPRYEARLDSDSGSLQLAQQADIYQGTDEEWSNVALTLSTSEPSGELQAPELQSEFLNLYTPVARQQRRVAGFQMADTPESLQEIVVTANRATARVGNFAVSYDMPGRTTISNDSDESITLDLDSFDFTAQLITRVVPRESTQAFLTAKFVYDQAAPLYGSTMTVFVDGAFAGYTEMPTAMPQEEVLLPMGQDRRIVVSAKTQGGADDQSGIINRRRVEATDYLFEITNRRAASSQIEVLDLYPVARNKAIRVEVPRTATPPDERDVDDQPGIITWKKSLGPGEEWQIRHQYSVSYPADQELTQE